MLLNTRSWLVLLGILAWTGLTNSYLTPFHDEMYYWEWTHRLALSYYDHPPMIAYGMKLMTMVFGNGLFALRLFGQLCWAGTGIALYALADCLFHSKRIANCTFILFMLMPLTMLELHMSLPEAPLALFWALTLLFTYRLCEDPSYRNALWCGISAGGLILSKYTGLILFPCLLIYTLSHHRNLFKTRWPYLTIVIGLCVASPVFIWNFQHGFSSFIYQFHHGITVGSGLNFPRFRTHLINAFFYFGCINSAVLLYSFKVLGKQLWRSPKLSLLFWPFIIPFVFHSILMLHNNQFIRWLQHAYISPILIVALLIDQSSLKKTYAASITTSLMWMFIFYTSSLIPNTFAYWERKWSSHGYELMQAINAHHILPNAPLIFTVIWQDAATAHYALTGHPKACSTILSGELSYAQWCAREYQQINDGTLPDAYFIGDSAKTVKIQRFKSHFKTCKTLYDYRSPYMVRNHGVLGPIAAFYVDYTVIHCQQNRLKT